MRISRFREPLDSFLSGLIFSIITAAVALTILWLFSNAEVPRSALALVAALGVGFGFKNWGCSAYAFGLGILGVIWTLVWGRGSGIDGICVFVATGLFFASGWYLGFGIFSATLSRKQIKKMSE